MKRLLLGMMVLVVAVGGWSNAASGAAVQTTISLVSSPDELIGGGVSETLTDASDTVRVYRNFQGGIGITWNNADYSKWWQFDFVNPAGPVTVGQYLKVAMFPYQGTQPGMEVCSYRFWNCGTITGEFTVTSVVYGAKGQVEQLELDFVQSCDGSSNLRGHISYQRAKTTAARFGSWGSLKSHYR